MQASVDLGGRRIIKKIFFKQKTAYEIGGSDWSSDVCSSDLGKDGINVNVICPLAWTAQLEKFEQDYPEAFKQNVKMPPMGHYGNVETEIGRVCVQLASPDFKYLSGETLTLEGGMGLRP